MKRNFLLLLLPLLALSFFSCQTDSDLIKDGDDGDAYLTLDGSALESGRIRVKLASADTEVYEAFSTGMALTRSGDSELDAYLTRLGAAKIKPVFTVGGRFEKRQKEAGLHLWYEIIFDEDVPVTRAINDLSDIDLFEHVEGKYRMKRMSVPYPTRYTTGPAVFVEGERVMPFNDPDLVNQWHYDNDGSLNRSKYGCDINLFPAWNKSKGDPSVIVAIIDGGIDINHPDLIGNLWVNDMDERGVHGWNFVDDNADIVPDDHGTHVAGTVAAVNNNGIGVAGVAGGDGVNPGVRLMSCAVAYTIGRDDYWGDTEDAFVYAADHGAVIAQNSWGYTSSRTPLPETQRLAIDYFIENAGYNEDKQREGPIAGGIVIFAAGNDGRSEKYMPGAYERVIAVSALTADYNPAVYTNYGSWVDIAAPGGTTSYARHGVLSSTTDNSYTYYQGTSMACPHVSGVAALIVSYYGTKEAIMTNDEVIDILYSSSRDVIYEVNPAYEGLLGVGLVDAGKALSWHLTSPPAQVKDFTATTEEQEMVLKWTVGADTDGDPVSEFIVFYSTSSLDDMENNYPADTKSVSLRNYYDPGTTVQYTIEGLPIETLYYFAIQQADVAGNLSPLNFTEGMVEFKDPEGPDGPNENKPKPVLSKSFTDIYFGGKGDNYAVTFDLSTYFSDSTGEVISYSTVSSAPTVISAAVSRDLMKLTPVSYGTGEITVKAQNAHGTTSTTFRVTVRDDSQEIDMYPNPVSDYLYLRMGENVSGTVVINVYSSTGQRVIQTQGVLDPFVPTAVDMRGLSSGNYSVVAVQNGKSYTRSVTKY